MPGEVLLEVLQPRVQRPHPRVQRHQVLLVPLELTDAVARGRRSRLHHNQAKGPVQGEGKHALGRKALP